MASLQETLRNTGRVSEGQLSIASAEIQMRKEMEDIRRAQPAKEKEKRLGILRQTSSPDTFRKEARKLLLSEPSLVQDLLNIAHARDMQKKKDRGGTRLIANLYELRGAL